MNDVTRFPAALDIDYPDRDLNRLTTFFRPLTVIPIAIVLALVSGPGLHVGRKYPRWWFDWNVAMVAFSTRVFAYLALLRDEYPSTDEQQAVHIAIPYPDARELNRWLPLVKWLLAIPHYIVLALLTVGVCFDVLIAWFAILFTGRFPRGLFDFIVGVLRWWLRVSAYAFLLTTDQYPPFQLSA
jgi:roadblock/LC7 domain-containing protein